MQMRPILENPMIHQQHLGKLLLVVQFDVAEIFHVIKNRKFKMMNCLCKNLIKMQECQVLNFEYTELRRNIDDLFGVE